MKVNQRFVYLHYQKKYMKNSKARYMWVTARMPKTEAYAMIRTLLNDKDFIDEMFNVFKLKLLGRL
jgi:hypothetical protein